MSSVMLGVIGVVAVQFAIGVWVSRRIRTNTDFIIAGRSLGVVLLTFSTFATFFGAEAIVGTAGSVYESGLAGSQIDPFGYALAIILVGLVFAGALWRRGLTTFADFFRERYSPLVEKLVVLVLLPGSIFWAAAQIRSFGQVVSVASGFEVEAAIAVAAILVVGYSVLGGLLADAWTDLVQGLIIIVGLVVLAVIVIGETGGLSAGLAKVPAERMDVAALGEGGVLELLESFAIPICGTIVAVEIISRVLGARSAAVASSGAIIGGALYLVIGLIPVYLGLMGAQLIPGLEDAEQVVPRLAEKLLPGLLYIVFAGAIISAILSTVDSVLLASSAQISQNLIGGGGQSQADAPGRLAITRLALVALAVAAYLLALNADSVKALIENASAAGSAGTVVVTVFGLFTSFGGPASAVAAIVAGTLVWLGLTLSELTAAPYLAGIAAALVAYVGGAVVFPNERSRP